MCRARACVRIRAEIYYEGGARIPDEMGERMGVEGTMGARIYTRD